MVLLTACGTERKPTDDRAADGLRPSDDRLHLELEQADTAAWVRFSDPGASSGGVNLMLYRRRLPMIVDMNGRVLHHWPRARAIGRARMDDSGRLTVIAPDNSIKEFDWEGALRWTYELPDPGDLLHHDFRWLANGNLLVLANDAETHADYLLEVDREGAVVWQWRFDEHRQAFPQWDLESDDPTHANSVFELGPNRWFDDGDERFRPGNILLSARNLDCVFIVSRPDGDVVWSYSKRLDRQHEATMIASGEPRAGMILLFNNGLENRYGYRRSRVQIIDPIKGEPFWRYASENFFSSVGGTAQALPGGNILISSSQGGRVFEVTPRRRIVWEFAPPYLPMRAQRLPADACPQLAFLEVDAAHAVEVEGDLPFLDKDLYRFASKNELAVEPIAGRERGVLPADVGCRELRLPPEATFRFGFGIRQGADGAPAGGRFRVRLDLEGESSTLVDLLLSGAGDSWARSAELALGNAGYETARLCLDAEIVGVRDGAADRLVWSNPQIRSEVLLQGPDLDRRTLDQAERELLRRQLEALGYAE
jgi:hypothetical protein